MMAVTAGEIAKLRKMVNEPEVTDYSDDDLTTLLEEHSVTDVLGEDPWEIDASTTPPTVEDNEDWMPTYDLHAAAAEIWEEKAAGVAAKHDFSADGAKFEQQQVYESYMKLARYHRSRRRARNQKVLVS